LKQKPIHITNQYPGLVAECLLQFRITLLNEMCKTMIVLIEEMEYLFKIIKQESKL